VCQPRKTLNDNAVGVGARGRFSPIAEISSPQSEGDT
jgi:hypothetical protein